MSNRYLLFVFWRIVPYINGIKVYFVRWSNCLLYFCTPSFPCRQFSPQLREAMLSLMRVNHRFQTSPIFPHYKLVISLSTTVINVRYIPTHQRKGKHSELMIIGNGLFIFKAQPSLAVIWVISPKPGSAFVIAENKLHYHNQSYFKFHF